MHEILEMAISQDRRQLINLPSCIASTSCHMDKFGLILSHYFQATMLSLLLLILLTIVLFTLTYFIESHNYPFINYFHDVQ